MSTSTDIIDETPGTPPAPVKPKEPSSFRLIATLSVAGLAAGLVLVSIYLATLPRITQNRIDAINRAVFKVLPGTESVSVFEVSGGQVVPYSGPEGEVPEGDVVYGGVGADGTLVGYAVPAEGPGFMDTIKVIYGYDPNRRVIVGLEVLESRETPGLGDRIAFDPDFLASFESLEVEPEILGVKDGHGPNEVDVISGATISSMAVVGLLNESTKKWVPILSGPASGAEGEGAESGE